MTKNNITLSRVEDLIEILTAEYEDPNTSKTQTLYDTIKALKQLREIYAMRELGGR